MPLDPETRAELERERGPEFVANLDRRTVAQRELLEGKGTRCDVAAQSDLPGEREACHGARTTVTKGGRALSCCMRHVRLARELGMEISA